MAAKSSPKLQIPTSQETFAFRAIEQVLRNDPILSATTRTLIAWRDEDLDLMGTEGNQPFSWSMCPLLKISPFPSESDWITEVQHVANMTLQLQVAVQGTLLDNLFNYWSLIRAAFFPQDNPELRDQVMATLMNPDGGRINKPTITLQGYGHSVDDEGLRILIANGTIRFGMFVGT